MSGVIYILTNPEMRDLVKIGKTENLEKRLRELYNTSIPVPFECNFACEVEDPDSVERNLHKAFSDHRINPKREFFRISPESVKAALALAPSRDVTPRADVVEDESDVEVLNRARARAAVFHFSMVGIQPDAILKFSKNETHVCRVIDDRQVEFEGRTGYLSTITQDLHNREFGTTWTSARGPNYWLYEGETLTDRRLRMEGRGDE